MTSTALDPAIANSFILGFVPLDVPPPSQQFGFLPIMLLALLAVVLLVGIVLVARFRRKGRK